MGRMAAVRSVFAAIAIGGAASSSLAQSVRIVDRAEYRNRLRGMWLGECIANWTGIRTEGAREAPPFFTDADWGTLPPGYPPWQVLDFVTHFDPWPADDDTDIEYVYLHLLDHHQTNRLSPSQIRDGWVEHINSYIWVSNVASRELMGLGILPPATTHAQGLTHGITWTLDYSLMIDAQLTTEIFGALCPGMPGRALEMAELPIRTTARGYAAQASQVFVVMYSLAAIAPAELSPRDRMLWLYRESRKFIPDGSKAADVMDFVLAEYLASPDVNDWEHTRDRCYARYCIPGPDNPGFIYRGWYESSINFATGLIAMLYGEGDYRRTVQIGTLSGWDSDNGTATMGGLIGLLIGEAGIRAQFAEPLSSNYWISRTRDSMPDYVPGQPWEDRFELMADRMLAIVDREVVDAGGRVALMPEEGLPAFGSLGGYLLPPGGAGDGLSPAAARAQNPQIRLQNRGASARLTAQGGTATASCSVSCSPVCCYGTWDVSHIANGYELDYRGLEDPGTGRAMFSTQGCGLVPGTPISLQVVYDRPLLTERIRFFEGDHFYSTTHKGGWFETLSLELQIGGLWLPTAFEFSEPLDPLRRFQIIDLILDTPLEITGIRISGSGSASHDATESFITCLELEALAPQTLPAGPSYDLNADGEIDVEDLYHWMVGPIDLNADGATDVLDAELLRHAIRWGEVGRMQR